MDDYSCSSANNLLNTAGAPNNIEIAYRSLVDKCICDFIQWCKTLSG